MGGVPKKSESPLPNIDKEVNTIEPIYYFGNVFLCKIIVILDVDRFYGHRAMDLKAYVLLLLVYLVEGVGFEVEFCTSYMCIV